MKLKKTKKSKKQRGDTTHGWGARKKHKGSGHRGGFGMAGTGKRADHKKTLIHKLYGNKYFGKQGITSKRTAKKRVKAINLRNLITKLGSKNEIILKDYKILGDGEISKAVTVTAKAFTKSAKQKIEKAGGKAIVVVVKAKESKPITSKKSISPTPSGVPSEEGKEQSDKEQGDNKKDIKKEKEKSE